MSRPGCGEATGSKRNPARRLKLFAAGAACLASLIGPFVLSAAFAQGGFLTTGEVYISSISPSPWYLGTNIPVFDAASIGMGAVRIEITSVSGSCRMWVYGEPDGGARKVTRQFRSDYRMQIAASAGVSATHVGYAGTYYGRGTFAGVQIDEVKPYVASVEVQERFVNRVLYSGPVTVGQVIPFTPTQVSWFGTASPGYYGVDGGAIQVSPVYTVQEAEAPLLYEGVPSAGQVITNERAGSLRVKLTGTGCSLKYRAVVKSGGGGGGGGGGGVGAPVTINSWAGTWTCTYLNLKYPAKMTLTITGQGRSSQLRTQGAAYSETYTITGISPNGDTVSGTLQLQNASGVADGAWTITFKGDQIELTKKNLDFNHITGAWQIGDVIGTFMCGRQ